MGFDQITYDVFLQIKTGDTHETIQYLEELHWDVNKVINGLRWTALHLAAYQGNYQLVEYLICKGANIQAQNQSGYTPLMLAEYKGFSEMKGLLDFGCLNAEKNVIGSSA